MTGFNVDIEGFEKLLVELNKLEDKADTVLTTVLREQAEDLKREIQSTAPVKTGNLRKSTVVKTQNSSTYGKNFRIMNIAPHAHLVEYGHDIVTRKNSLFGYGKLLGRVQAKPFMRPVWDRTQNIILKTIESRVRSMLNSVGS